jgi:hypothetical protein
LFYEVCKGFIIYELDDLFSLITKDHLSFNFDVPLHILLTKGFLTI